MEALHDVVKSGKARYIGASAMYAWQFQKSAACCGKERLDALRVDAGPSEPALTAKRSGKCCRLCREEKIAVTPYSPMASGRLTRDWSETSKRMETDNVARSKYDATADKDRIIVERLAQVAADRGVSRVEIALAWLLQKEPVVAPIIGATKLEHLEKPVEAISVKLTDAEVAFLEEPYVPHLIIGHS